jgi:hypothetical protein
MEHGIKKILFLEALLVLSSLCSAQEFDRDYINTSAGQFFVEYRQLPGSQAREMSQAAINNPKGFVGLYLGLSSTPSNVHWECIKKVLSYYYNFRRGDGFHIIVHAPNQVFYHFLCDFTSDANYNYWFFRTTLQDQPAPQTQQAQPSPRPAPVDNGYLNRMKTAAEALWSRVGPAFTSNKQWQTHYWQTIASNDPEKIRMMAKELFSYMPSKYRNDPEWQAWAQRELRFYEKE